jgi:hypothetical protein
MTMRLALFSAHLKKWLLAALMALALALPNSDRLSRIAALALLLILPMHISVQGKAFFRRLETLDYSIGALALSALLSGLFGLPAEHPYDGFFETLVMCLAFFGIRHGNYDQRQLRSIGIAIVLGALIAEGYALYDHLVHEMWPPSLPAIKGTIRSSLYVSISSLLAIGLALCEKGLRRWLLFAAALGSVLFLLALSSRAVIVSFLGVLLLAIAVTRPPRLFGFAIPAALICAIAGAYLALPDAAPKRQIEYKAHELAALLASGEISANDRFRMEHWRLALAWMRTGNHWLFGVGPRNFQSIGSVELHIDPPLQFSSDLRAPRHAHNIFLTKYIEEGIVGLTAMITFFTLAARRLIFTLKNAQPEWSWWGALGGLLLPIANGMVGSPWFKEYALLAVMTLALHSAAPASPSLPPLQPEREGQ